MTKEELRKNYKEVSSNFKMSEIKHMFNTLDELKERQSRQATVEHLYPRIVTYNQRAVLQKFMEKLNVVFKDRLLINTKDIYLCNQIERNGDDIIKRNTFDFMFQSVFSYGCHLTFSIDNYIYYIQFADNPLFEDSSYITTKKVIYVDTYYVGCKGYATQEYYGGGYNINDLIEDIFSSDCDIEFSAENLFKYFMEKCYQQESRRYCGEKEKLTFLQEVHDRIIELED